MVIHASRRRYLYLLVATAASGLSGCNSTGSDEPTTDDPTQIRNRSPLTPTTYSPTDSPIKSPLPTGESTPTETEAVTDTHSATETVTDVATETETSADTSWPMFRYDASNTGHTPSSGIDTDDVETIWTYRLLGAGEGSPSVNGVRVYAASDAGVVALSPDATVEWRASGPQVPRSTPAIINGRIYVGSAGSRREGLFALDAASGKEVWRAEIGGVEASPTFLDQTLYITNIDGQLIALNTSGEERWRFETNSAISSTPAAYAKSVYFGDMNGIVYSINTEERKKNWEFVTGSSVFSSPAVVDDTVYVGSDDNRLYALNAKKGSVKWRFLTGGGVCSSPAVAGGTVYVGSDDGNIYALDAEDGMERWQVQTNGDIRSSPAVAGGTVYVGSDDGNIYALDAEDGKERWSIETDVSIRSSPAVIDGRTYVTDSDGKLYAIGPQS